jgi:hypothetical protein
MKKLKKLNFIKVYFKNIYLCFWCSVSYHQTKPEDPRNINKKTKQLFIDYYNKEKDIKNHNGVEFVEYDKEYTDEALDNEEHDKKNETCLACQ